MKRKIMAAMLAAALLSGAGAQAGDGPSRRIMREAISLYEGGMYERAQTLFESLGNDAEARGYAVLCAATLQTPGYESLVEAYEADFPGARMADRIHYRMALNAFSKEDYEAASLEFMLVDPRALPEDELAEYTFKRAYSDFGRGDLANARRGMEEIQGMPFSDYTGPSRYALGYIAYAQKDFPQACTWFEQSAKDPRFTDLSNYYLLECKFMQKDYRYVVENGIALYDSVPEERRPHLARILSESYLVMGDAKKARSYYDSIGQQVDIVTLHGNIELGPLLGMVDRIVDITATGTTLAENNLVAVDEIMSFSARFFASPAAYRCDGRIRALAARLAAN